MVVVQSTKLGVSDGLQSVLGSQWSQSFLSHTLHEGCHQKVWPRFRVDLLILKIQMYGGFPLPMIWSRKSPQVCPAAWVFSLKKSYTYFVLAEVRGSLLELVIFFHHVNFWDWIQVTRVGSKGPDPLSHLAGTLSVFWSERQFVSSFLRAGHNYGPS